MEYTGWANPYGASIGDTIARSGDAAAHAAEMIAQANAHAEAIKGATWAGAIQNVANLPMQIEQTRDAAVTRKLKQQELEARSSASQETARQRVVLAAGHVFNSAKTADEAVAGITNLADLGGFPKDVAAHIVSQVQAAGPDGYAPLQQQYVGFASQFAPKEKLGEKDRIINSLTGKTEVDALPQTPKTRAELAADAANQNSPTHEQSAAALKLDKPDVPHAPTEAGFAADANDSTKTPEQRAAAKAALDALQAPTMAGRDETARHNTEMERIANLTSGREAARDAEIRRHNLAGEAANDAAPTLSDDARHLVAKQFAMTGQLPPMGNGKQGAALRTAVFNDAAEQFKGLDLASQRAAFDANKDSLKKLQVQRDAISAFEQTATKNIDIFLDTAGKVVDTGSPLANGLLRQASGKVLGSADQAAYDAARQVAVNEIAKITSNPNLSGTLSDSARHEIEAFNPQNATLAQSVKVMRLLKQDMANRASSMDDQIKAVQQRIATPPGAHDAAAGTGTAGGQTIYAKDQHGVVHQAAAGTPLPAGWVQVEKR